MPDLNWLSGLRSKIHSLFADHTGLWVFILLVSLFRNCYWGGEVVYLLAIFLDMGYNSSCSDDLSLLRSFRVWWNLGFSCLLLGENSLSFQNLKCFCLTQFVGLSINYLGEMGCEWEAVNMKGWNMWSKGLNCS